ncbi:MAG: hypothetical protein WAV32_08435, partial [Halobacteriota archaeon]
MNELKVFCLIAVALFVFISANVGASTGNITASHLGVVVNVSLAGDESVMLEVHAKAPLTNGSDCINLSDGLNFESNGRVRITTTVSELTYLFAGAGQALNATIAFVEAPDRSEKKAEGKTSTPGLIVLPADVWQSSDNGNIVLEMDTDKLLLAWSQWMEGYEICYDEGNGSIRLTLNTSELMQLFARVGERANATVSFIMDTGTSEIKVVMDTTPPELTVLTPEEGKTYATREILLTVKADEPSSHWRYRLN